MRLVENQLPPGRLRTADSKRRQYITNCNCSGSAQDLKLTLAALLSQFQSLSSMLNNQPKRLSPS